LLEATSFKLLQRDTQMFDYIPQEEHPEKNAWWINELESLGVDTKSTDNKLNNKQDNSDLTEAIKQTFMEEYKQTYNK
jgi:hypothetical protein